MSIFNGLNRERRIAPRRNTNIAAVLLFDGGRAGYECTIRDVSATGAKLELAAVAGVPNTFDLLVPGHRLQPSRVVWRALREMGVEFVGAAPAY